MYREVFISYSGDSPLHRHRVGDAATIPDLLRPDTRYNPPDEEGDERLYRRLTEQPAVVPGPVDSLRRLHTRKL